MSTVDRAAGSMTSGPAAAALPPEVRVVVFDVVGTLVTPRPAVAVAYQRAAARHGVERGVVEIESRFRDAWCRQEAVDAASRPSYATSPERERERWRAIVADVFEGVPATERIFADLWAHFASPAAWCQTERGPALVRWALDAGRGVALASNFDDRLLEIARHVEPLPHAGRVFTSAAIGWRKPAPEFFRHVEERLGCAPGEIMLVGDDPLLDLAAGRLAGWHVLGVA